MQEMQVRSLGWEDPLEKEMAILSSILAWDIPWTEEPGGLQYMGLQKSQIQFSNQITTKLENQVWARDWDKVPPWQWRQVASGPTSRAGQGEWEGTLISTEVGKGKGTQGAGESEASTVSRRPGGEQFMKEGGVISEANLDETAAVSVQVGSWEVCRGWNSPWREGQVIGRRQWQGSSPCKPVSEGQREWGQISEKTTFFLTGS